MKKVLFTIIALIFSASLGYSQVTTLWEKSAGASTLPSWFDTVNLTRALGHGNGHVYIVSRNGGSFTFVYDATTGDSVGVLDATDITGGTYAVSDVEVSTDGKIFVCNLAVGGTFKVYSYDNEASAPVAVVSYDATGKRVGDKFTVTGSTADNSIVIWAASASTGDFIKFTTADNGVTFTPEVVTLGVFGGSASVGPLANADFYYNATGLNPMKFDATGTSLGTVPGTVVATGSNAIRFIKTQDTDEYFATFAFGTGNENARLVKVPGGDPTLAELFGTTTTLGTNGNGNGAGDVAVQMVDAFTYNIYVLSCNNGFGAYQVDLRTPLAGDYYIPQGSNPQGFATIFDAVTSLNFNGAAGTVNILLDADTLREQSFTFNANLSDVNNVVVKPAPGRDVCLIVTPGASMGNGSQMIGFDKGYVTFDGSNDGSTSRNLIVTTETDDARVPFGLNTANADTVVLKNLIIKNLDNVTLNFRYGAVINDVGGVMGFRVENCQIGTALRPVRRDGLAPWGGGAISNQFSFVNNEIYCGTRGVATIYLVDSEIIGNTINIMPTTAGATDTYNHGIYITGHAGVLNILGNTINCLEKTFNVSSYLVGIAFAGNSSTDTDTINVFNNFINVGAADETRYTYGIGLRSGNPMGNLKVYYNTILINDNASALVSYGIGNHTNGTGPVNVDLKDNIIINNHTGNTGSSAIGLVPATSVLTSDYNDLLSNQNLVNYQGTTYPDLADWQTASGQDANSVSKEVFFASATDLHLTGSSDGDFELAGTPIAGITLDIDGETRSTTAPYKGADEGTVPLSIITIAEVIEDLDNDFVPDRLGQTVTVQGVVFSPNYQTTNNSYYISDGTAGTDIFMFGPPLYSWNMGDELKITGVVTQFNGMSEIVVADSTGWVLMSSGNPTPDPTVLTLAQFKANAELYEGSLVGFVGLNLVGGTWPASGSTNLSLSDGIDTVVFRIDSDTDIDGSPEPAWPVDVIGIGSQFDNSAPYNSGYQIFPRFYATDFLPAGSLPVELTSFVASVNGTSVNLNWSTATEINNNGFEIQRNLGENFVTIGFVKGSGTTTEVKNYSYTDNNLASGNYSYRLKQVDFNGTFEYSNAIEVVVVTPNNFELSQNYPNPFNPNTVIEYSVASPVNVTLTIYSVLGEQIAVLVNNQFTEAGKYSVQFNASNLASGTYIYRLQAGEFVQTKKMMLTK